MIKADTTLTPADLLPDIDRLWQASAAKIDAIDAAFPLGSPTPVVTVDGVYQPQGWTEWTEGFQHGSAVLQFDATGDEKYLEMARQRTRESMASHLTHVGVHDHGFNNVSTYGNLLRLIREGRVQATEYEAHFYELALKVTGAVQADRWASTIGGGGYIYSFNGPQSLFVDTIRSCRALAVSHMLGHALMGERDEKISLLARLVQHARSNAAHNVYYGTGKDHYDIRGRTCHEALFNTNNGDYRAPSTQQGYSAFTTWTRGLAWAMAGYPEQLEYLAHIPDADLVPLGGRDEIERFMLDAAEATCDFYCRYTPTCGVPYWDTGAPGLAHMGDYLDRPAEPHNDHEPVDSSAAAIGAQGLLRLGRLLTDRGRADEGARFTAAGLTTAKTLFTEPYLSTDASHQGLLLHTIYHRPRGWDHVPAGRAIPCDESCMWGDYHLRELALYIQRLATNDGYYTFFRCAQPGVASVGAVS